MKNLSWILVIALMTVVITSCETTARVQKDNTIDFKKFKNYAWVDVSIKDSTNQTPKMNDLIDRKIKASVDRNLSENGWTLNKKNPDVLIAYEMDVEKESRNVSTPVYTQPTYRYVYSPYSRRWVSIFYPSEFYGYRHSVKTVQQHTLTITLVEAETDKTIWQGWTTIDNTTTRLTDGEIDHNVHAIIKKLKK